MLEALAPVSSPTDPWPSVDGAWLALSTRSSPLPAALSGAVLMAVLDEIDYGLIVVDTPSGRLRHANRQALDECRRYQTLLLTEGHVAVADAVNHRLLLAALAQALQGRRTLLNLSSRCEPQAPVTAASADEPAPSISVTVAVVPLPRDGEPPQALLVFGKRQGADALSVGFFARLHGLTPTEDAVLLSLCRGMKPTEIAAEHGVAISTVRTHVNSVRLKTGTASIRDLVHRVATLPPMASALRAAAH